MIIKCSSGGNPDGLEAVLSLSPADETLRRLPDETSVSLFGDIRRVDLRHF
jgi:hypothetical protein